MKYSEIFGLYSGGVLDPRFSQGVRGESWILDSAIFGRVLDPRFSQGVSWILDPTEYRIFAIFGYI